MMFEISSEPLNPGDLALGLADASCGGYVSFEGWVRNHQDGRAVRALEYEVYAPLALSEGKKVLAEALDRFDVESVAAVHAQGKLAIGDLAVWVGAVAHHRAAAFDACRYAIDQVKVRLPIWKKEYYRDGHSGWVNCEQCAAQGHHQHGL
ncbi:MAG: molybdenum cofactor biosynthesis protein MoaE [Lysobacterales bacterium]